MNFGGGAGPIRSDPIQSRPLFEQCWLAQTHTRALTRLGRDKSRGKTGQLVPGAPLARRFRFANRRKVGSKLSGGGGGRRAALTAAVASTWAPAGGLRWAHLHCKHLQLQVAHVARRTSSGPKLQWASVGPPRPIVGRLRAARTEKCQSEIN